MDLRHMLGIGTLYFIGSCNSSPESLSKEFVGETQTNSLESLVFAEASGPNDNSIYFLKNDDIRCNALEKFVSDSFNPDIVEANVNENLVVIKTKNSVSQGYLIDDCGLVLTVAHVARDIERGLDSDARIYDMKGGVYSLKRTELFDYFHDYAILVADTNKPQKTHPLNFINPYVRNCGDSADFFSGITIEVNQENLPRFLGVQDLHEGGNIMCVQHTENYLTNIEKDVFSHSGPMLESQLRRGFFFISETVKQGYSGAPVFSDMSSENPKFLGLVQGNLINNKTIVENLGIVTDGGDIFNGLIDYFDNLKD